MRRFIMLPITSLVAASILVGCQGVNMPLASGARYSQLTFGPASQGSLTMVKESGKATTGAGATADARLSAPMAAPAPSMMVAPGYPGGYYGGGGFWGSEYELVSTTEAKAPAFNGTYADALEKFARPMVQEWAPDAVLRSVSGNVDGTGINPKPTPSASGLAPSPMPADGRDIAVSPGKPMMGMPMYDAPTGWRFEFASKAKRESLHFVIGGDQTLIIKQTFKERQNEIGSTKLGSAEVIALVTKAIQDKSVTANDPAQSSGGGTGGVGIAYPAKPMVDPSGSAGSGVNTTTAVDAGPAGAGPTPMPYIPPQEEELFTVPANARWDLNLNNEQYPNGTATASRLIWNVNMNTNVGQAPAPGFYVTGAWARVDATTGQLLSLSRPRKITQSYATPETPPMPMPMANSTSATATGTATSGGTAPKR